MWSDASHGLELHLQPVDDSIVHRYNLLNGSEPLTTPAPHVHPFGQEFLMGCLRTRGSAKAANSGWGMFTGSFQFVPLTSLL